MALLLSSLTEIEWLKVIGMNFEEDGEASMVEIDDESITREEKLWYHFREIRRMKELSEEWFVVTTLPGLLHTVSVVKIWH